VTARRVSFADDLHCGKIAEAEACVFVNEKKWLVMLMICRDEYGLQAGVSWPIAATSNNRLIEYHTQ
jgi:hypothetical protein